MSAGKCCGHRRASATEPACADHHRRRGTAGRAHRSRPRWRAGSRLRTRRPWCCPSAGSSPGQGSILEAAAPSVTRPPRPPVPPIGDHTFARGNGVARNSARVRSSERRSAWGSRLVRARSGQITGTAPAVAAVATTRVGLQSPDRNPKQLWYGKLTTPRRATIIDLRSCANDLCPRDQGLARRSGVNHVRRGWAVPRRMAPAWVCVNRSVANQATARRRGKVRHARDGFARCQSRCSCLP